MNEIDCSIMTDTMQHFIYDAAKIIDFDVSADDLLQKAFRERANDPYMLYASPDDLCRGM